MNVKPIIFSREMVLALLAGDKTQTRRLASSPLKNVQVGDRLYVRENFYKNSRLASDGVSMTAPTYCADLSEAELAKPGRPKVTPCIHMPRKLSRITLVVTGVKFECAHDISEADSKAEGVKPERDFTKPEGSTYRAGFEGIWRRLHGVGSWMENPDLVAITFGVIRQNVDSIPIWKTVLDSRSNH